MSAGFLLGFTGSFEGLGVRFMILDHFMDLTRGVEAE